jgi:hypothetical protein
MAAWSSRSLPTDVEIGTEERFVRLVTAFSTLPDCVQKLLDIAASAG